MNQAVAPWTEATQAGGWCGNSACQQGGLGPSLSEDGERPPGWGAPNRAADPWF